MPENSYVYKKEVDWSLLHQGLSIPLNIQIVFQNNISRFIQRGQSKEIFLVLDGNSYKANLVNQKFDNTKYPDHKDILQIRYNPNSEIAVKLKSIFSDSYKYIRDKREYSEGGQRSYIKIPDEKKEYLAVYTTQYEDTYLVECITDTAVARSILIRENEQEYETSINYDMSDPRASIQSVQQMTKIRKLNKAIGENLKLLYENKCQICGDDFGEKFETHIVESHHIDPFVVSLNNDSSNQIIICPNHHRVIHKTEPILDRTKLLFLYSNGFKERLLLNRHL